MRKDAPDSIMGTNELIPFAIPYSSFGKPESTTAPWKDSRVRIALHRAIDFDSILNFQSNKDAFQAAGIDIETSYTTHSPRILSFWLDPRKGELGEASKNYLYDVAEAKKLVEAAGYPNGFEIPMNAQTGGNEEAIRLQVDFYKKSGFIQVKENWMPRLEYFDNVVYNPNLKGMSGTSSGGGMARNRPEHGLQPLLQQGTPGGLGRPQNHIILKQRREFDSQKSVGDHKRVEKYICKEFYVSARAATPSRAGRSSATLDPQHSIILHQGKPNRWTKALA